MNVLVIAPHPDDESIGCGGAIRQHASRAGDRVTIVFLTSGERGLKLDPDAARQIREREAEAAAQVLGAARLSFLRLPDTHVADHAMAAATALAPILAHEQPARIYVPHPLDNHPDHTAALPILWTAIRATAADGAAPPEVLGYEVWTPMPAYDDGSDITAVMADKLRAVRCHRSQIELLHYDRAVRGLNHYRGALAWKCRYAEVYQHLFPAPAALSSRQTGRAMSTMDYGLPQSPLATVIIDNFNYARFLREAIDSAVAQTYPHLEVIVVDDGSTDSSREIIAEYGDRIRPVLKSNGGQGSAFNAGFEASRGDVVLFLDSDDRLSEIAVERAVAALADQCFVKAQWQMEAIDESGAPLGRFIPGRPPAQGDLRAIIREQGPSSAVSSPTSGNAWTRSFLRSVMPVPQDVAYYKRSADEYLFTLAAASGLVRNISQSLGQYRVHAASQYSAKSFDEKLQIELAGFDEQCHVLERFFQERSVNADVGRWREGSWWRRLQQAVGELRAAVPAGQSVILIDDGTWGMGRHDSPRPIALVERDGVDWGPPADDADAIAALEHHRAAGVRYLAIAWPAFWWITQYRQLLRHLRSHGRCIVENHRLLLFDLSPHGLGEVGRR